MLLYIHGYQGSPGDKFDRVVRVFGGLYEDIRAPQLRNVNVASDLAQLRESAPEEDGRGRPHLFGAEFTSAGTIFRKPNFL